MMEINFTIPDKYVNELKEVFDVTTIEEFKEKVRELIRKAVRVHRENLASDKVVIEEDLIS